MKFEKDSHGVVRVAKGDKSGKGGQFAETVKPEPLSVEMFDTSFNDDLPNSGVSYENYLTYDPFEESFTKNLKAVVAFGAHQPFTRAHELLADFGKKLAVNNGADFIQFTTAAYGKTKKHVIPLEVKKQLIQESLGEEPKIVQGPYQMFETLALDGYSDTTLLVGEDRESNKDFFIKAASEYGVELKVVVIPRPEGGISGTLTREAAANNDYATFSQLIAARASNNVKKKIFNIIR